MSVSVVATTSSTSAASIGIALILSSGAIHSALLFVHELLDLTLVATDNQTTMHGHLNQIFRGLGTSFNLVQESAQQVNSDLFLSFDGVDALLHFGYFGFVISCQLVAFDVGIRALDNALNHKNILFLRGLNGFGSLRLECSGT